MSNKLEYHATTRVFLIQDGKIFLMLRNGKNVTNPVLAGEKKPTKRWISPGGATDPGESDLECAIRETEEEIGIKLESKNVKQFFSKYDPKYNVNMVFFYCQDWKGKISVQEKEKFDRVEWIDPANVSKLDGVDGANLGIYIEEAAAVLISILKPKKKPVYAKW